MLAGKHFPGSVQRSLNTATFESAAAKTMVISHVFKVEELLSTMSTKTVPATRIGPWHWQRNPIPKNSICSTTFLKLWYHGKNKSHPDRLKSCFKIINTSFLNWSNEWNTGTRCPSLVPKKATTWSCSVVRSNSNSVIVCCSTLYGVLHTPKEPASQ